MTRGRLHEAMRDKRLGELTGNSSDVAVRERIDVPVEERILGGLSRKSPEFVRAYEENGMKPEEFDSFGATRRTLRQFICACYELNSLVRNVMLPNPDAT